MDTVDMIVRYENDELSAGEIIDFYQHLIDTGLIRVLQGHYQRGARMLIEQGLITLPEGK